MIKSNTQEGTNRLCWAVYKRAAEHADYLDGSQDKMRIEAAELIEELRSALDRTEQELAEVQILLGNEDLAQVLPLALHAVRQRIVWDPAASKFTPFEQLPADAQARYLHLAAKIRSLFSDAAHRR